jgi:periplasmic protein TonB
MATSMDRYTPTRSASSRTGPAIAVIALHIGILYVLLVSMGVVRVPTAIQPLEAVFIPETEQVKPEPVPVVKPEIDNNVVQPVDEPMPQLDVEEPIAPPTDVPMPASENAINATAAQGAPAQDLKTSTRVDPTYPPASRRAGEEGTVRIRVLVDEHGRPKDVNVAQSSGHPALDEAALAAVRKWRFVAATNGQQAISAWTQVAVTFKLTTADAKG